MKHSLATGLRQVRCELERRRHRFGKKSKPPTDKRPCGVVGAGRFFHYAYVPALNRRNSPLFVSGIWARRDEAVRAAQRALRYETRSHSELETLLDSGIDAVVVLAPNALHFQYVRLALERGLHVFCEKPVTNSVADASTLHEIVERTKRTLMVDFNERYLDRNRLLGRVIEEGRIGRPVSVHAYHNQNLAGRWRSPAGLQRDVTGGGVVHNAGIHFINLFLHWFGVPERVHAVFENRVLPQECGEDTALCRFWFGNGVTATLEASLVGEVPTTYERIRIVGERGELNSDLKKGGIVGRLRDGSPLNVECEKEIISDSVFNALCAFERCVREGVTPETDIRDSIRTMKVVEALTWSALRAEDVRLEEVESKYAG